MRFGILELQYRVKINLRKVTFVTLWVTNLKIFMEIYLRFHLDMGKT